MMIMKKFKQGLLILFSILLILAIGIVVYGFYLRPNYEGELKLRHIQKQTTVYFDQYGIPHIYSNSQKDAMVALGYVHAQDRLWQMELLRRIAPGKLAAIFGTKALKTDRFFAGLGIEEASEKAIAQLDKNSESYQLSMAYLDGINQFIEQGQTPVEFKLLGLTKTKFEIKDIYNVFGFMSFSFAMAQKTDPLLTDIRQKWGALYLQDFGINGELNTTQLQNFDGKTAQFSQISSAVTALLEDTKIPAFIGSNSWVIGAKKTKNGKVILANDPHIAFSQPATWYEAHIKTPDYEMYGYHLAGTPFPLLGHNRKYAYGITMFENDDIDLYQETENPKNNKQYATPTGFENYTFLKKIIKVKDSSNVAVEVKISRHGTIMNGILDGLTASKPVAMSWTYTQQPIKIIAATYALCHAKNLTDFKSNIALIAAPGLNIMYGDALGNIAWSTSGKLYKHQAGVNPNFVLDGASGKDDVAEYLDFSKNPHATNPPTGFVYSANNQPQAVDGFLYPGYYLPEDRAKRITTLLTPKNDWNKESVSKMIVDNSSSTAQDIVQSLLANVTFEQLTPNQKKAFLVLKNWKASHNLQDTAPTIYNKWLFFYLKNTFEDELGEANFKVFMNTHIMKQVIAAQIKNENSPWWDNVSTEKMKENSAQIITKSFVDAVSNLEIQLGKDVNTWRWSRVHLLEHQHAMGKIAVLRSLFNVGPVAVAGSNEVINNLMFDYTDAQTYAVKAGPSTRRIIDFSDIENCWSILPTGQSGNMMSPHYDDQAGLYREGKFRKMMMNKSEIMATSTKLVFLPNSK